MPRLSIFSFDTLQTRVWPGRWLLYWLLLLLALEGLLSLDVVTAHLPRPEPTLWYSPRIQVKLDYLHTFAAQHPVDVLFIGNSTVQAGLNPVSFDQARLNLQEPAHASRVQRKELAGPNAPGSFNGALEALPPSGILWFLEIYLQQVQPATIIYGLTPQDLNANNEFGQNVLEMLSDSPLALAQTQAGWRSWLTAHLLRLSQLYRYRFVLHQFLLRGGTAPVPHKINFDARGFAGGDLRLADEPASTRSRHYAVIGNMRYHLSLEELAALRQVMQLCAAKGVQLILVNMPLADDYYASFPNATADYSRYIDALTEAAQGAQIPLWDMETLPANQRFGDTDFYDFHHLNREGAEKLSALVAQQYVETVQR